MIILKLKIRKTHDKNLSTYQKILTIVEGSIVDVDRDVDGAMIEYTLNVYWMYIEYTLKCCKTWCNTYLISTLYILITTI